MALIRKEFSKNIIEEIVLEDQHEAKVNNMHLCDRLQNQSTLRGLDRQWTCPKTHGIR
jgi:hypothetical protein